MYRGTRTLFGMAAIIVFLSAITIIALYRATNAPIAGSEFSAYANNAQTAQVAFSCDEGKTLTAIFMTATTSTTSGNNVQLSLSDGRQVTLPQVISADGGRYANKNENFVFWTKGEGAFVQENGRTTYSNCAVATK